MLANRISGLLPTPSECESLEVAALHSISGRGFDFALWGERPFRAPHHSASSRALIGGGNPPCPGEVSLAHCGVLFLDEFPEFARDALEALREPIETGVVAIARTSRHARITSYNVCYTKLLRNRLPIYPSHPEVLFPERDLQW